jgi:hypothetical protein
MLSLAREGQFYQVSVGLSEFMTIVLIFYLEGFSQSGPRDGSRCRSYFYTPHGYRWPTFQTKKELGSRDRNVRDFSGLRCISHPFVKLFRHSNYSRTLTNTILSMFDLHQ